MLKRIRNLLRTDPSRTGTLRRAFEIDLTKRFNKVRRAVWQMVYVEDSLGLAKLTTNAPNFKFDTSDQKLRGFNKWLKKQVVLGILEVSPVTGEPLGQKPWLYKYIDSAYKKGALRAYVDIHARELGQPMEFYEGSKASFLESAFGRPERTSKLRLLYTRTYENLNGITSAMATQMSRVLADGMAHGRGVQPIARELSRTITGITRKRALVLARTEIINAHSEGQLDSYEDLGVEELGVDVEWSTSHDSGVCPRCKVMEGKVFTIKEARGLIPKHPNCRCAFVPSVKVPTLKPRTPRQRKGRPSMRIAVVS